MKTIFGCFVFLLKGKIEKGTLLLLLRSLLDLSVFDFLSVQDFRPKSAISGGAVTSSAPLTLNKPAVEELIERPQDSFLSLGQRRKAGVTNSSLMLRPVSLLFILFLFSLSLSQISFMFPFASLSLSLLLYHLERRS